MMHGCRQLVSWDVGLSPETSATLVTSCQRIMPGTLVRLLVNSRRKAGMTSSHHVPYAQGDTHATMGSTKGCNTVTWSQSQKTSPSSDCGLQLDHMKPESLVSWVSHTTVNMYSGIVHTARHTNRVGGT